MTFILGAAGLEISAIEKLLQRRGVNYFYAAASGERVTPDTAYRADGLLSPDGKIVAEAEQAAILASAIVVECDFPGVTPVVRCDHHRPGDPGYGRPSAEYWQASSIGQVCSMLGIERPATPARHPSCTGDARCEIHWNGACMSATVKDYFPCPSCGNELDLGKCGERYCLDCQVNFAPDEFAMIAAADHCLAAAYAGKCPGVDREKFAEFRNHQRAKFPTA